MTLQSEAKTILGPQAYYLNLIIIWPIGILIFQQQIISKNPILIVFRNKHLECKARASLQNTAIIAVVLLFCAIGL